MVQVSAFRLSGIKCWFYSNDHDPPHFHAERSGTWECRVNFQLAADSMLEFLWHDSPMARSDRRLIEKAVKANRSTLLKQWEEIHSDA